MAKHHDPKINKGQLATHYGYALAFMNSDPELKKLFNKAVRNTWTTERFVAALRNTHWFKNHSASVRNAIMQKTADPASWKEHVDQMRSTAADEWQSLFGSAHHDPGQLQKWAETALTMGWSEAQLVDHMIKSVKLGSLLNQKKVGGTAAETQTQIQMLASQYGLKMGKKWVTSRVRQVLDGSGSVGGVQAQLNKLAQNTYTAFADRLQGGETMQDIADPYIQKMSDLLEINPGSVGIMDNKIQRALTMKDPDTGKASPMNLADFADMVRQDKRWQYTDNARESVASLVAGLGRQWGVMA